MLHIGFDLSVPKSKVEFIAPVDSPTASIKRLLDRAKNEDRLIDHTKGKARKSLVVTSSGYFLLSAINATTLRKRYHAARLDVVEADN